ncbi:MAG: hypothetical protein I8N66_36045 [Ensifer sp. SSB1]|nr:hypothetical protein [Ensifer sp. SSB1]
MAVYHARRNNRPLCGATGNAKGFHAVAVSPKEWNALDESKRCKRCAESIRKAKQA